MRGLEGVRHCSKLGAPEQRAFDLHLDPEIRVGFDGVGALFGQRELKASRRGLDVGRLQGTDFVTVRLGVVQG